MAEPKEYPSQEYLKTVFEYRSGRLYWKKDRPRGVKKGDMAGYISDFNGVKRYRVFLKNRLYVGARIIFMIHHGYLPYIVDHIDRNPLNDDINNLRAATKSENQRNCKPAKNSSSKYLGVSLVRGSKWKIGYRWRSSFRNDNRTIHVGYFKTEQEAALAFNHESVKYNGEFASLNIVKI